MKRPPKNKIKNYVAREDGLEKSKLFLYGDVSDWYEEDISAKNVQRELAYLGGKDVEIHINSYGGDLFEGIAIYNLIKNYKGNVTTVIDGVAASAASVIVMAGSTIRMPKNTQILVHNPWTLAFGNADDLLKIVDDLRKAESSLEECYLEHFTGDREQLRALLAEDKYLTALEAKEYGFCDVIEGDTPELDDESQVQEEVEEELTSRVAAKVVAMLEAHKDVDDSKSETVETPKKSQNKIMQLFAKEKK